MKYVATKEQIEALMKISTECTQLGFQRFIAVNHHIRSRHDFENQLKSIEHHCYFNALTNFAWWTDRNGNKIEYWNGDLNPTAKGCKCAQTASCEK